MSLNIKVISQYQFVCTRLSSAHTPTRKLVGVWALDKLVHTNRYCEITYNIYIYPNEALFTSSILINFRLMVKIIGEQLRMLLILLSLFTLSFLLRKCKCSEFNTKT